MFQNVEPCNKPVMLALDVSGSMAGSMIAGSCISAREGSAAMALITAATEPECEIIAFSALAQGRYGGMHGGGEPGITRVKLSPRIRLAEAIKRIQAIPMGGTDCALPMLWAARTDFYQMNQQDYQRRGCPSRFDFLELGRTLQIAIIATSWRSRNVFVSLSCQRNCSVSHGRAISACGKTLLSTLRKRAIK
jgi:hypothetical protein